MSEAEILKALPGLGLGERREIFERIGEMEEQDLLKGGEPIAKEKAPVCENPSVFAISAFFCG